MDVFAVLGDPVRRRIVELLAAGERSAGALGEVVHGEFGISQPAVSQHLRTLREAGLVTVRADGARRFYAVRAAPLRAVGAWLDRFRPLLAGDGPAEGTGERWSAAASGLANRLDALDTEIRRGRRDRAKGELRDDRSAG